MKNKKVIKEYIKEKIIKELSMENDAVKLEFTTLQLEDIISIINRDIAKIEKETSLTTNPSVKMVYMKILPQIEEYRDSLEILLKEL